MHDKLNELLSEEYLTNKITICGYYKDQLESYEKKVLASGLENIETKFSSMDTSLWAEGWKDSFN